MFHENKGRLDPVCHAKHETAGVKPTCATGAHVQHARHVQHVQQVQHVFHALHVPAGSMFHEN
jgi:hypothetical protein